MEPRELTERERNRIKRVYGYTDEDIASFSPKQRRLHGFELTRMDHRMIAEVVEVENCAAQHKVGDKYVYGDGGALLPEESTVKWFCCWAIAPIMPFFYMFYDRMSMGLNPADMAFEYFHCTDTGLKCGGWGKCMFEVHWEKVSK